jgi:hypothetical protein
MTRHILAVLALLAGTLPLSVHGQAPDTPEITFTAVSANVAEPGQPVRIRIFRWSSDRERSPILASMDPLPPPPAAGGGQQGAAGAAGRGGRAGGRGGRGRAAAAAVPPTPEQLLAGAIRRGTSVGYIWTNDVTGYAIKYAFQAPLPDGGRRIVLATDRRFGTHTAAWQPTVATPLTDHPFTVIEMRLDAKGSGEAKTSLTTKVVVDKESGTLALEDYAGAPAMFQKVTPAPSAGGAHGS